jgi:hypothetical protein
MSTSRRDFIQSAIVAAAAVRSARALGAETKTNSENFVPPTYFDFNAAYSTEELAWLYQRKHLKSGKFFENKIAPPTVRDGVLFFCDTTANKLINPANVTPDPLISASKQYTINAEVLNFHPSSDQVSAVWSKLDTNLQLTLRTHAVDSDDNLVTSISMAGINVASQFMGGSDGKLVSLQSGSGENQLTSFPPAEQVAITNGQIEIMVGLAGQKKASFWDHLLTIVKEITNSPIFGLLPIPKLYQTASQTVETLLSQVEQSNRLVQVLNGKKLFFRICNGSAIDPLHVFVLRSGYWIVLDAQSAGPKIDPTTHNIDDWSLDVEGEQYELKDKDNHPVDITYSVASILLPEAKSTGHS